MHRTQQMWCWFIVRVSTRTASTVFLVLVHLTYGRYEGDRTSIGIPSCSLSHTPCPPSHVQYVYYTLTNCPFYATKLYK